MPAWLSDEWLAAATEQRCAVADELGVALHVVIGGRGGGPRLSWPPPAALAAGQAGAEDVVFTLSEPEARAVLDGERDPAVAFMRGDLKTAGPPGAVLALLACTATQEWDRWRRSLRDATGDGAGSAGR